MFYPIRVENIGPNQKDHTDHFVIQTVPGTTNMSHQELTDGWLGSTNDWSRTALGEFETLEEARESIRSESEVRPPKDHEIEDLPDPDEVERWMVRDLSDGDLVTFDWDDSPDITYEADGLVWLWSQDQGGTQQDDVWVAMAEGLNLDPRDRDSEDVILDELRGLGWRVEVAEHDGWDCRYIVGTPPKS
jgi:hypothetical protein